MHHFSGEPEMPCRSHVPGTAVGHHSSPSPSLGVSAPKLAVFHPKSIRCSKHALDNV